MLNECFVEYKDKHKGERGILFGTAPSVDKYDIHQDKFKDFVKFGTNEIIYKPYKMDYYFIGDVGTKKRGYLSDEESYNNYKPNIAKFYRAKSEKMDGVKTCGMPKDLDATYYNINGRLEKKNGFMSNDITQDFRTYATISVDAVLFAVWTGIKELYLIGHDCNYNQGTFKTKCTQDGGHIIKAWGRMKDWLGTKVKVYIINPVSLKIFDEITYKEI